MGDENPSVPNKKFGCVCVGGTIAPIFFNAIEDARAPPIIADDVTGLTMGNIIDVYPYDCVIKALGTDKFLSTFTLSSRVLLDIVQAGGRVPLIIGKQNTWARETLRLPPSTAFRSASGDAPKAADYTLAQKMVAKARGLPGVLPGMYLEPKMTTVGSQDTTVPMTRDELKDLACWGSPQTWSCSPSATPPRTRNPWT